jgi:PAS domain S-box-containing protein
MALVAVVILVGGYLLYRDQEQQMRQRVEGGLSIIAQLEVEQIAEWRAERLTDADMLVGSPFFTEGVAKYMASPTDTEIKDKVIARLAIIGKSHPYQDILLVNVNGKVLLSLNDSVHRLSDMTLAQLAVAIKEHKAVMVDFHYPPDSNTPHLDVIAPLFPWQQDSQQAIGAVVFCIDPSHYLYPLVQSWPIPSETAEILLVERDGDQVLFLNKLRHQKDTALKLRIPLSRQEVPAVMAVLGKEGVVEGRDYRGVEVLAALEHIPDSPWYMVAKIDTSEAISALRFRVGIIIASVAGLLAAALAVIGLIWQRRQRLAYQVLYRAEIEAQALRSHFEYLVKYANDIIFLVDENHTIVEANDRALETYGYTREEMLGLPLAALIAPGDLSSYQARLRKIQQKGTIVAEAIHQRKNGSTFPVEISGQAIKIENKPYLQEIGRDITERKAREQEYQTIIRTAIDGFWITDMQGHFLDVNEAYCHLTGYSRDELLNMSIPDVEAVEKPEETAKRIRKIKEVGHDRFETCHRRKDSEIVDVEVSVNYLPTDSGRMFVFIRDITERKRAEEALRQSEEKHRIILKEIEDSYFEVDLAGNLTFFNDSTSNSLGYSAEELMGMSYREFTAREDIEPVYKAFNKVYRTNRPNKGFLWKVVRKDGTVGFVEATVSPLRNPKGEIIGFRGVGRDITERKQAEEERRQLEQKAQVTSRLASVGEMAAGVAHEINNPLTGVIGYAQLLMDRKDIPSDIRRDLAAINEGAQRVASIVKRLLAFSRQVKPERRYVDINELIESTLALRAYHLSVNNIKVATQLAPDLPETVADPGQLQQVFLNLVVNAETEMKLARGKGKLLIKTEKVDNTIRISFKDNGPGIAKKNLERIFDPFFTTREIGQGTGLGLSLCYGIVAEHNGKIYAESKLGKGATFIMELPVITEAEQPKPSEPVVEEPEKVAKAKILVVDDEQVIRDFVKRVLAGEGYEVETVNNAGDALKKIEGKRYNLVLIDIKMPGMDGMELYKRIQKIARSLARRVVFITGDIMGTATEKFLSETKAAHIDKPFNAEQLSREINRALTGGL